MMKHVAFFLLATCLFLLGFPSPSEADDASQSPASNYWHQWRGPEANGVSATAQPPLEWSEEKNVRWKAALPGSGSSTPIVWGDRLFLLTAVPTDRVDPALAKPEDQPMRPFNIKHPNNFHQFTVICLDRKTGKPLWQRVAVEKIPHAGHHGDNNFASASPTTDGKRLYAWFGSIGLFCYDLEGELLWKRELGEVSMRRSFGEGSSPVIAGDRLILTRDQEEQSRILVLNAKSGETIWEADRDEPSCWATPLVVTHGGRMQVITNGSTRVRSYDLEDGKLLWECGGQVANVTPSPVTLGGLVFCMSGYRGSALFAMPLDSEGDISDSDKIAWSKSQGTPYVPSPLLYDDLLYFNQSNNAILSCLDAKTGEVVIERTRMPDLQRIYASPVGAAGRIYFVGRDGTTLVLKHGRSFEVLATNRLDEPIDASPALVGDAIYLRGSKHVYCLAKP